MAKDTVIVLKSVNYSEADKVLTVLGKYTGKFSLFAKGIRKINSKNRGNMQTLSISDISFYEGRGLHKKKYPKYLMSAYYLCSCY